jgi:hypothetical protein
LLIVVAVAFAHAEIAAIPVLLGVNRQRLVVLKLQVLPIHILTIGGVIMVTLHQGLSHDIFYRGRPLLGVLRTRTVVVPADDRVVFLAVGELVEVLSGLLWRVVSVATLLGEEQLPPEVGDDVLEVLELLSELGVFLLLEFVLLLELVVLGLVQVLPVALGQGVDRLVPPPVGFSLERVPLQGHLPQLSVLHLQLLTKLPQLLLVIVDLVHVLCLLELVLVQGPCHLLDLTVPLGEDLVHVVVLPFQLLNQLGETLDLLFFCLELFRQLLVHDGKRRGLLPLLVVVLGLFALLGLQLFEALPHSLVLALDFLVPHEDEGQLIL